jgi:hypothetical protein
MRRNDVPTVTMPSLRTNRRTDPANSGLFALFQEISGSIRLRGGPGRTRTSNQVVMRWDRRARFRPACCAGVIPPSDLRLNSQTSNNIIQKGLAFARERSSTVTGSSRPDALRRALRRAPCAWDERARVGAVESSGELCVRAQSKSCAVRLNSRSRFSWVARIGPE